MASTTAAAYPDEKAAGYNGPQSVDAPQGERDFFVAVNNASDGEDYDNVPQKKRQLGIFSVVLLIFNRVVGTGIFATPATILRSGGSVGMSFMMWLIGAFIAMAGTAVYMEFGTGLPRNGGEKNYLEYIYRHPKFLITCTFGTYAALLGWCAGNSLVFGEYIIVAARQEPTQWNTRGIAFAVITFAFIVHTTAFKWGLRLQNLLGSFKVGLLLFVALSGFAALAGRVRVDPKPDNFSNAFEGTGDINANAFVNGMYSVIWSYIGYSNANYALTEIKNPVRTLRIAGPLAIGVITVLYMLVNVAYFAAVPKEEILTGGRTVAAAFFRNMFGPTAERALSVFVALSALGNILSVLFSQGRVVQELAREGVLPFSSFFASNRPFGAPMAGLGLQWAMSLVIILAPPPGDAFNLVVNLVSYPLTIINSAISGGLILLYTPFLEHWDWNPPFRASLPVVVFFFVANVFLAVAPLIPPAPERTVYLDLPYYLHVVISIGIFTLGAFYWLVWVKILPKFGNYKLERVWVKQADGVSRAVITKTRL
ncbi:high affinity methionine permease [Pterulicium gracile]|uniref:High affinity methionine permease n=1 Tax=Pterulicium gracile TaxID=1884261 RepID=A0A5C3QKZ2_9AGAR|nr:high affinity methionine permease [Pterula gracilis]